VPSTKQQRFIHQLRLRLHNVTIEYPVSFPRLVPGHEEALSDQHFYSPIPAQCPRYPVVVQQLLRSRLWFHLLQSRTSCKSERVKNFKLCLVSLAVLPKSLVTLAYPISQTFSVNLKKRLRTEIISKNTFKGYANSA